MRRFKINWPVFALSLAVAFLLFVIGAAVAEGHYYSGCKGSVCKRHVIKPHTGWLAKVRWCETRNRNIHGAGGVYHGYYQFDWSSWRGAGGRGDPHRHVKLTQSYRAVIWLHRAGRGAWPNCG